MDENIVIPILIDKSSGLSELKKFGNEARTAIGAIGPGARAGEINVDVRVRSGAPTELRNIGTSAIQAGQGLKAIQPGANAANYALLNLNRVVQDAPFGMMGITNNINPLLESFQKLKRESGSTGNALKALAGSLIGGGGLGLAVAAVSAALTFGSIGLQMWKGRANQAKTEAGSLTESQKSLSTEMGQSIVKLTSLVGITQSSTAKLEDKKKAIRAINQEYGQYLSNLGKEGATLQNVAAAYDQVIEQMIRQAVVKGLQNEIAKEVEKTAGEIVKLEMAEKKRQMGIDAATLKLKNQETAEQKTQRLMQQRTAIVRDGFLAQTHANQATEAAALYNGTYEKRLASLKAELMGTVKPLLQLTDTYDDLGTKLTKTSAGTNSAAGEVNKFSEYQKEFASNLSYLQSQLDKDLITPLEFAKQKLDLLTKAGKDFQVQFNQPADGKLVSDIDRQVRDLEIILRRFELKELRLEAPLVKIAGFDKKGEPLKLDIPLDVSIDTSKGFESIQRNNDHMRRVEEGIAMGIKQFRWKGYLIPFDAKLNPQEVQAAIDQTLAEQERFSNVIESAFENGMASLAEGIGNAIATGDFSNMFKGMATAIGSAMQDFGKMLIEKAIVISAAKKAAAWAVNNPVAAVAAGAALIAAGAALKSAINKKESKPIGGFADGGVAYGPQLAWVGESPRTSRSNPEIFGRFDQVKALLHNEIKGVMQNKNISMGGGNPGTMQVEVVGKISGRDLLLIHDRQNNYSNR